MSKKLLVFLVIALLILIAGIPSLDAQEEITLTADIPVQGEISEQGEHDIYRYEAVSGEIVSITVRAQAGSSLDTVLEVYDSHEQPLIKNDDVDIASRNKNSSVTFQIPVDGSYQILVRGFADQSTGSYELLLLSSKSSEAPVIEDNQVIALNESQVGTLTGDSDIWLFTSPISGTVQISMFATMFDTYLDVYDSYGNQIASDDDSGGGYNAAVLVDTTAGATYEIHASTYSGDSDGYAYVLSIQEISLSTNPAARGAIFLNMPVTGELQPGSYDYWWYQADTDSTVQIMLFSTDFDVMLEVYNGFGSFLLSDDDSGGGTNSTLNSLFLPGNQTYEIRVKGYSIKDRGSYILSVIPAPPPPEPRPIEYGQTVESTLLPGMRVPFEFEASTGDMISVTIESEFDAYLELWDENNTLLAEEDIETEPALTGVILPEDGIYTLIVRGYTQMDQGDFRLTLINATAELEPGTIGYNENIEAMLPPGQQAQYTFSGQEGDVITITVEAEFDGIMEVYNSADELVVMDDDSGSVLNPYIEAFTLPADDDYTIVLRGFGDTSGGSFSLTLESDSGGSGSGNGANVESDEFIAIAYNDTQESSLQRGEAVQFTFDGQAGDVISVTVEGEFDAMLALNTEDGQTIDFDDDSGGNLQPALTDVELPESGTYILIVSSFSAEESGDFTITLLSDSEPIDTDTDSDSSENGEMTFEGMLAEGEQFSHTFTGTARQVISVAVDAEFDGTLELYNASGDLLLTDDDGGSLLNPAIDEFELPEDGEYELILRGFAGTTSGSYTITITGIGEEADSDTGEDTDSDSGDSSALSYGDRVEATLNAGEIVAFTFEGQTGDIINVRVESDFDSYLEVHTADGSVITSDDDSGGDLQPAILNFELPDDGTYTVIVGGFGGTSSGDFTIILTEGENEESESMDSGELTETGPVESIDLEELAYGDTIEGTLDESGAVHYTFTGNAGDRVTIEVVGEFDGVLELQADGETLTFDDDSGGNLNPLIQDFELPAEGAYEIILQGFGSAAMGNYTLTLTADTDGRDSGDESEPDSGDSEDSDSETSGEETGVDTSDEAIPIESGSEIAYGDVVAGTQIAGESSLYAFSGDAGEVVNIRMESEDFDGYLELHDAENNLVASDDDSGGNFNPLIQNFELPTSGTYTIVVASFGGQGEGNFTLLLSTGESASQVPTDSEGESAEVTESASSDTEEAANVEETAPRIRELIPDNPVQDVLSSGEVHSWTFTPFLSGTYAFAANSGDATGHYDPYIRLLDSDGQVIAEDDDGGDAFNAALVEVHLEGGNSITVEISGFEQQSGGAYTLVVSEGQAGKPESLEGGTLSAGDEVSGTLTQAGQTIEFVLTIDNSGVYNIIVEGLTVPYVDIYDSEGNLLGRSTDLLVQQLEPGTYTLVVYDRLNNTGDFTLTVVEHGHTPA